ncbi:MAG: pseudouridine synthase [Candidatus Sericytochromatia bacterium]
MKDFTYLLFYKPYNVICQFSPEGDKITLKEFIKIPEIYPVGRLDTDSEGLIIITDDNQLKHILTEPKFKSEKTYYVQVEGIPQEEDLNKIRNGISFKDYKTLPAKVRILENEPNLSPRNPPIRFRKNIPTTWLEIIINEGKNRQIRKMTAHIGFPTLRLVRVKIKHIEINNLKVGEYRFLSQKEVIDLKKINK